MSHRMLGNMATSKVSRVVSVLPSATEVLCIIGADDLLVGRSHEDNFPEYITDRPILTASKANLEGMTALEIDTQVSEMLHSGSSLYVLNEELLASLNPEVILTQDICAVCAVDLDTVRRVSQRIFPTPRVVSLNPQSLRDVLDDIELVGAAVGMYDAGVAAKKRMEDRIATAMAAVDRTRPRKKVAFIEWSNPIYVGGHWTPQIIKMAGGEHTLNECAYDGNAEGSHDGSLYGATGGAGKSFPIPPEQVVASDPDVVIICPCGFKMPESQKEADNLYNNMEWYRSLRAVKNGDIYVVDGDAMFNRPGPRLVDCLEWLVSLLQNRPDLCPKDFPVQRYVKPQDDGSTADERMQRADAAEKKVLCEIEELHTQACAAGERTYKDPATGYTVITEHGHTKRGFCCGHRCRHCPYGHFNVSPELRKNRVQKPTYLRVEKPDRSKPGGAGKAPRQVDVLFWSGGKDSFLTMLRHDGARRLVLLTTYSTDDGMIKHQGIHHHEVMNQAKKLGRDIVLVPLPERNTLEEYTDLVRKGLDLVLARNEVSSGDVQCLFGDLHLEDLREWRKKEVPYPCVFPVFGTPYKELMSQLFSQENVSVTVTASSHDAVKVGTPFTQEFVDSLPDDVDAMGERGEFHTLVTMH
eukprot:Rhum_TRINITY_DN20992_c0_g1::Rhum_TRINITY_DN20992_c0_g1_i1::g.172822::m.172822/K02016/ABC.FEV.S; iron complex transport system substrate-binding protein